MREEKGIVKYFDINRWYNRYHRIKKQIKTKPLRWAVERQYKKLGVLSESDGPEVVVADGMWDNPNHWFRLRLFLETVPGIENYKLLGILRSSKDTEKRQSLECMGFEDFIYLEEHHYRKEDYVDLAQKMLAGVKCHADLLQIKLPEDLPAYVYYDTVSKRLRHPQPPLEEALWTEVLAELLRNMDIYKEMLERYKVGYIVESHPWKNEWATLCWTAICNSIPCFHLTGYCESIRIRRFSTHEDYAVPVEHMGFDEFTSLPEEVQERIITEGQTYLSDRNNGNCSDINNAYAYLPHKRQTDYLSARRLFGVNSDKKLVAIYSHIWFDFPHTFAMSYYTDFLDWMQLTLKTIAQNTNVLWLLKPHPVEKWYGGVCLADLTGVLPEHVLLCPVETDSLTVQIAADAVVTVHGTIGIEAAAQGTTVLCADKSYYQDWDFAHNAGSREDYIRLLSRIDQLEPPTKQQSEHAAACAYIAFAPTPEDAGSIKLKCDSSGLILYKDILSLLKNDIEGISSEKAGMRKWISSKKHSYSVYQKLSYCTNGFCSAV